ncbi:MAG: hypothetical protein HY720_18220 [Planctomycetes bacterium]|nr:hypothetical protein [Planctomycetota bacterium]
MTTTLVPHPGQSTTRPASDFGATRASAHLQEKRIRSAAVAGRGAVPAGGDGGGTGCLRVGAEGTALAGSAEPRTTISRQ